jgi:hypothetical protein
MYHYRHRQLLPMEIELALCTPHASQQQSNPNAV